jgi:hypothetical protein
MASLSEGPLLERNVGVGARSQTTALSRHVENRGPSSQCSLENKWFAGKQVIRWKTSERKQNITILFFGQD